MASMNNYLCLRCGTPGKNNMIGVAGCPICSQIDDLAKRVAVLEGRIKAQSSHVEANGEQVEHQESVMAVTRHTSGKYELFNLTSGDIERVSGGDAIAPIKTNLFIGGPLDGQHKELPPHFDKVDYRCERFRAGDTTWEVWLLDGVTRQDAMAKLLAGYRPEKPVTP